MKSNCSSRYAPPFFEPLQKQLPLPMSSPSPLPNIFWWIFFLLIIQVSISASSSGKQALTEESCLDDASYVLSLCPLLPVVPF